MLFFIFLDTCIRGHVLNVILVKGSGKGIVFSFFAADVLLVNVQCNPNKRT